VTKEQWGRYINREGWSLLFDGDTITYFSNRADEKNAGEQEKNQQQNFGFIKGKGLKVTFKEPEPNEPVKEREKKVAVKGKRSKGKKGRQGNYLKLLLK